MLDELVSKKLSDGFAADTDKAISEAVTTVLGTEWTLAALRDRLRCLRVEGDSWMTWTLDDKPLIAFSGPTISCVTEGDMVKMVATMQSKRF